LAWVAVAVFEERGVQEGLWMLGVEVERSPKTVEGLGDLIERLVQNAQETVGGDGGGVG
jgi:hypothetical protein